MILLTCYSKYNEYITKQTCKPWATITRACKRSRAVLYHNNIITYKLYHYDNNNNATITCIIITI